MASLQPQSNIQSSLARILQAVRSTTAASEQNLRTYAEQNNSSVQKVLKDIYRVFSSNSRANAGINSALEENAAETQRFSGKIDSTNSLLQQTLSIQSVMLSEIKSLNNSLTRMFMGRGGVGGGAGGAGYLFGAAGLLGGAALLANANRG